MNGATVSGLVAFVAWAALAGWIAAGVLLVLAHRRIEHLERAHTARKWDLLALRAELAALRRGSGADPRDPAAPEAGAPQRTIRGRLAPRDRGGVAPGARGGPVSGERSGVAPGERGGSASGERGGPVPGDRGGPVPGERGGPPGAAAWRRAHRPRGGRTRRRPG